MISLLYKNHPDKPTITFTPVDAALLMARSTIKLIEPTQPKKKRGCLNKNKANKQAKS